MLIYTIIILGVIDLLGIQEIFIRLFTSLLLGGLIGIEREGIRRPAGLRTHILVCISSSLIMLSGIYLSDIFVSRAAIDPSRLGAQVISGIGFLGAGTILKINSGVRGLTTAASLWSVAGIGIACGIGFYSGAILCTVLILFSLMVFGKIERLIKSRSHDLWLEILCENSSGELGRIGTALGDKEIHIRSMETNILKSNSLLELRMMIILPKNIKSEEIISMLTYIDGVKSVKIE